MEGTAMKKAFFLDRDGVIIEEENYLSDPAKARLCSGCCDAFKLIRKAGYAIVAVSNQSGIARGYFSMDDLKAVEARINALLAECGTSVDAWYYCPHLPAPKGKVDGFAVECDCRKPAPGLILKAAKELSIDVSKSFLIGDKISDIESAQKAGCLKSAMVLTGHGAKQETGSHILKNTVIADNILDAVKKLLA